METSARHFIVGIGVLTLIAMAVLASLWYFRGDKEDHIKNYVIYFKKQSVSGLQIGSVITMRGIRIGEVQEISILTEEAEGARVQIKVQENAPVSTQTRAVIERNLLTGLAWIELGSIPISEVPISEVGQQQPPRTGTDEHLPFILEGEGEVQKIKVSLSEAVENLNMTLNSIQIYLNEDTRTSMQQSLTNLEEITSSLAVHSKSFGETINRANELMDISKNLMTTLKDASKVIANESVDFSHSFSSAANRIVSTIEEYRDPRKILRGPAKGDLGPGEKP